MAVQALILTGSNVTPAVDRWSDVDLVCVVDDDAVQGYFPATGWLAPLGDVVGVEQSALATRSITRVCFADFRRVDFIFIPRSAFLLPGTWHYRPADITVLFSRDMAVSAVLETGLSAVSPAPEFNLQQLEQFTQQFCFKAALAITKVMRKDLLIGMHLALDLSRDCLVLAMIFRDVETGTRIHRQGGLYNEIVNGFPVKDLSGSPKAILDLISRSAYAYDALALRKFPDYRPRAAVVQRWIDEAASQPTL